MPRKGIQPSKVNTLKSKAPEKMPINVGLNKYRRLQTLQKKCAEIAYQCDVDIVMIIRDRKFNRFKEYNTSKTVSAEHISKMMSYTKPPRYQKVLISFDTDEHSEDSESEQPSKRLNTVPNQPLEKVEVIQSPIVDAPTS